MSSKTGFYSTSGNQIIDSTGASVKLSGISWFGMDTSRFLPDGLHVRGYASMIDQMKGLGFNTIRIPISNEMLDANARVGYFDASKNPDLVGATPLQVLDKIIDYAGRVGMKIILDNHRSDASPNGGAQESGLWYTAEFSEARWIADWAKLAHHYAGNATVIGAELRNEPFGGTWGGGGANDWAAAAERAGNAVLKANPDWLIFVEGVRTYQGKSYWDGGNLMGVKDRPIVLSATDKLVYTAHDYPPSVYEQPWFNGAQYPANLTDKFREAWGYIFEQNIAPVWISEFGSRLLSAQPKDAQWFQKIAAYLSGDFNADGIRDLSPAKQGVSWNWWSWNPNSGDTGGILKDDWTNVDDEKIAGLKPLLGSALENNGSVTKTGTDGSDVLIGTTANDRLDGHAGADLMQGGDGNDVYIVDNVGDRVVELDHGGIDTVLSGVSFSLPSGVENLRLTGSGTINASGNSANNVLIGNVGNNVIVGGGGSDRIVGGGGQDKVDGGAGVDILGIDLPASALTIVRSSDGTVSISYAGGSVQATGVELLQTHDGLKLLSPPPAGLPHPSFDEAFYFANNPDVQAAVKAGYFTSGLQHFQMFGEAEGRAGAPSSHLPFDEAFYFANNPDVEAAVKAGNFASGLQHFQMFGDVEGRSSTPLFDNFAYRAANPDVDAAVKAGQTTAFDHYLMFGEKEGRLPSSFFSKADYYTANPDVAAAGADALQHLYQYGVAEGRMLKLESFDLVA